VDKNACILSGVVYPCGAVILNLFDSCNVIIGNWTEMDKGGGGKLVEIRYQ